MKSAFPLLDTAPTCPPRAERGARPLRIALAAPPWFAVPPPAYGGIESMLADLADALVERGNEVYLVSPGPNGTRATAVTTYSAPPSEHIGDPLTEIAHAALSAQLLADLDVDVIHDHSLAGPLTAVGARPRVLTAHGPCTGQWDQYYRVLAENNHLVAISWAQRRTAPDTPWAGTVHNGIRVNDFPFQESKDDYVLFLGRFSPDKGPDLAIESARRAGRRIILAGKLRSAHEHEYFDQIIKPLLGTDAQFIGEADSTTKKELLAAAHCLLFPIRWAEPFGMVMIEAMACGTPVVALRQGSVPEVVAHGATGLVCDTPAQLPDAVDAAGHLSAAACRQHARMRFDASVMAAEYERVYEQALGLTQADPEPAPPAHAHAPIRTEP
jgi:glycosyltransferase involved in cell wall biosynthesis